MAKKTVSHELPYPETGDDNKTPTDVKALADKVDSEFDALDPGQIIGGAAGQLIIVKSTGAGAFKTLKGDATLAEDGTLTIGNEKVGTTKLADKAVTGAKVDDATLGDGKLISPNNSVYRTLLSAQQFFSDGSFANTYALQRAGESTLGPQASGGNSAFTYRDLPFFYLDDADYTVAGLTQKLRLRAQILCNATKAALKFTFGLYPITVEGAADTLNITLGAVIAGSTAAINEPAASTASQAVGADFAIPADGAYVLGVVTSAKITADSYVLCSAQLQSHSV